MICNGPSRDGGKGQSCPCYIGSHIVCSNPLVLGTTEGVDAWYGSTTVLAQGSIDLPRPELPWMIRRSRHWRCSRVFALYCTRRPPRPAPNCHSLQIWIKAPSKSRQKRPSLGPDGSGPKPRLSQPQGSSRGRGTEECDILAFAGFLEPFHLGGSPIRPVLWGQRVELGQQRVGMPCAPPLDWTRALTPRRPLLPSTVWTVEATRSHRPTGSCRRGRPTDRERAEAPVPPGRAVSASLAGF